MKTFLIDIDMIKAVTFKVKANNQTEAKTEALSRLFSKKRSSFFYVVEEQNPKQSKSKSSIGDYLLCHETLYMAGSKNKVFTKGKKYLITHDYKDKKDARVIDDENKEHYLGEWAKYFSKV